MELDVATRRDEPSGVVASSGVAATRQKEEGLSGNLHSKGLAVTAAVVLAFAVSAAPTAASHSPAASGRSLSVDSRFYVPPADQGALQQIGALRGSGAVMDANLVDQMVSTPQAVWLTGGTPKAVQQSVLATVQKATAKGTVAVLVAYNLPFRDCSQYSAGGAADKAAYNAWIDGVAAGIGNAKAVVILEPDGLGIIPWYHQFGSGDLEWCQPAEADPATAAADRFEMLNYAVDRLESRPNASVYLDATHSGWLGVGDAAYRLAQAGALRAQGFFLNVSNFQATERLQKYGTWISDCLAFATDEEEGGWRLGHYDWCGSQYYPANPADFSTWHLTDEWYAANLGNATPTAHFVIDTSRNGLGPWTPPAEHPAGDPQDWCNPPARGAGMTPSANTGIALLDAYLWIKTPGQSDGQCYRWTSGPLDPVRGIEDPVAGEWFPEMALELARNANPALPTTKPKPIH